MGLSDLKHYIRAYDHNLDPALCLKLIESFHGLERFHKKNGRGVRAGLEDSGWMELNVSKLSDQGFLSMFKNFIDTAVVRYNQDLGLKIGIPKAVRIADLILKRYRPGGEERFQLHFDAINHVANRYLVLLWYLNDVTEGGQTRFPQLDVSIPAQAGRLLMFPPYWMYQHEGLPPVGGEKFIISTYLLFDDLRPL